MKKFLLRLSLFTLLFLFCFMAINGSEGPVVTEVENRWTADTGGEPGRYLVLSRPGSRDDDVAFDRRHYGWPCWALYIDCSTSYRAWYAKLDILRLAADLCVAAFPAAGLTIVLRTRRQIA